MICELKQYDCRRRANPLSPEMTRGVWQLGDCGEVGNLDLDRGSLRHLHPGIFPQPPSVGARRGLLDMNAC